MLQLSILFGARLRVVMIILHSIHNMRNEICLKKIVPSAASLKRMIDFICVLSLCLSSFSLVHHGYWQLETKCGCSLVKTKESGGLGWIVQDRNRCVITKSCKSIPKREFSPKVLFQAKGSVVYVFMWSLMLFMFNSRESSIWMEQTILCVKWPKYPKGRSNFVLEQNDLRK